MLTAADRVERLTDEISWVVVGQRERIDGIRPADMIDAILAIGETP